MPTQSVNQNPANQNVSTVSQSQAAPGPMNKPDDKLKEMQKAKTEAVKAIKQKKTEKKSKKAEFKDMKNEVFRLENTELHRQASKVQSYENKEYKAKKAELKFKASVFKDGVKAYDIISNAIASNDMQPVNKLLNPARLAQLEKKIEKAHLSVVSAKEKLANMIEDLRVKGEVLATKKSAYLQSKYDLKLLRKEKKTAKKQIKVIEQEAAEKIAAEKEAKSVQKKYSSMLRNGK
ncbi:MAG: hypothetical protein LVQ97_00840 [Candidatus Micrarchaeales archaeon]|nr:hypothetical protein [Candidatus Micrarchaeales archaeon]